MQDSLGFWIPRRGFRDILCQWKLDSRFQSLGGLPIPYAVFQIPNRGRRICWIPDSTSKFRNPGN